MHRPVDKFMTGLHGSAQHDLWELLLQSFLSFSWKNLHVGCITAIQAALQIFESQRMTLEKQPPVLEASAAVGFVPKMVAK